MLRLLAGNGIIFATEGFIADTEKIEKTGADFFVISENIDTSTAVGTVMIQVVGSFTEFARAMLRD